MKLSSIGTVIAKRVLTLRGGKKVTVELGKPRRFRGGAPDYYCPVRVRGLGEDYLSYSAGIDAFQAIELAMIRVGGLLYGCDEAMAGKLSWDAGQMSGDLGFPVPEAAADLLPEEVRAIYVRKPLTTRS
jgi:hypothetical protein